MRLFRRSDKIPVYNELEKRPLRVVGDASIASAHLADGRLVPLIIVDTTNRPDLDEFIRVHQHLPPGDVVSTWAEVLDPKGRIALVLRFTHPARIAAVIEFDIVKHGILVDQVITARLLYLQAGRPGDRFITNVSAPRIFVEIGATGFRDRWDRLWHAELVREFRARGLVRKQAKEAARLAIRDMRELGQLRMPSNGSATTK